jgi:hypothetical protein
MLTVASGSATAQNFSTEKRRIPVPGAGSRGLEAILVKPDLPGRLPLVLINHGSPRTPESGDCKIAVVDDKAAP